MEGGPRIIALDPATGRLGTTDLHARLTTIGPHPVVVPLRVESVTMQPPDLLELETLPTEPDGVTVYRARLAAAARADRYVAERLDRPITVIITGRPANDPEARPVTATIPVQVQLPPTTIHWRRADRPAEVDLTVDVEAEAGQEFALEVWVDRYDIATDRMVSDAAVEFTHMANDGRPSPLTKEQFRPHPDDLPWVRPETATRERSRWQVAADLPPPDRPELRPPVETSIRVRAWRTGSIAARHANAVTFSDRPRQLAEAVVPVVLGPVRLAVEVVEPDMPVPADGAVHEVVLQVTRVRDSRPPAGVALAFAPRPGAHPNPGTFEPTEVTLTPEAQGRVTLRWTTPELRYKPGDTYTVPLRVEQGPPDRRTLVDTVDLHLNPELSAEIRITKPGIAWDPVDVLWDAGRTPASILGTLRFPVRNRIPADRTETEPLVFDADVELWVIEGGVQTKVGETSITDDEGEFALVLPELEHTFSRPGPERRTRRLDPVRDLTLPTFHPDDAAPAIDWYDDRVPRYAPLAMFGTDLEQRVRHHRLTFADELATRPRTDADLAVSGVKLLGTAACYVHTYQQAHEHQWSTVADDLGGLFGELVNIVISAINIGDLLGDAAASVAQRAIDTFGPGIVRAVTRMAAFLEPLCQRMQTMLLGLREFVLPSAQQAYELAIEALDAVAHHLGLLRGGDLLSRVTALVEVIANGIVAAAQALWMTVTTAFRELARQAADYVVRPLQWLLEQAPAGVQELLRLVRESLGSEGIGWSLAKTVEAGIAAFLDWLDAVGRSAGIGRDAIRAHFDTFAKDARRGLDYTVRRVEPLDCSEMPDLNLAWAKQAAVDVRHQTWVQSMERFEISWWLDAIDLGVFMLEGVLLIAGTIFTGGVLATTAAGAFTQLEVGVGVIKTVVARLPLLWNSASFAMAISHYTAVNTASLGVRM